MVTQFDTENTKSCKASGYTTVITQHNIPQIILDAIRVSEGYGGDVD